jgi:uncharacterized protein
MASPAVVLELTSHRPWPLPSAPWRGHMCWSDLAFLHWPEPAETLRALLPRGLELDTFDGEAWIGVVPFRMEGVRHRWLPPIPTARTFPEINVRTYVRAGDRPGVWFLSLDAGSRLAVRCARLGLNLPYFDAEMRVQGVDGEVEYRSRRVHRGAPAASFHASYAPTGEPSPALPGTLDHWLTERYRLYGRRRSGHLYAIDIHHPPWPLQTAEVTIERNTMAEAAGVPPPDADPVVHFARRLEVLAWAPQQV